MEQATETLSAKERMLVSVTFVVRWCSVLMVRFGLVVVIVKSAGETIVSVMAAVLLMKLPVAL